MKKFVTFFAIFVMCGLSSCTKEDSVEFLDEPTQSQNELDVAVNFGEINSI